MGLLGTELLDMHAELNREVSDAAGYHAIATQWLDGALSRLAGDLRARIEAGPPLSDSGIGQGGQATGPPGSAWAAMWLWRRGRRAAWVYSASSWASFVQELADPPDRAEVMATVLDGRGMPSRSAVRLTAQRPDDAPGWVVLTADAPAEDFAQPGRGDQLQRGWLGFLREVAEDLNPSFGQLADDSRGRTALDELLGRLRDQSVADSRRILRGYSWVTICAQELAERLGGAEALRGTGAFHAVEPLRGGGVWLRATERYQDYDEARIAAVFRALAPVLPAGKPTPPPPFVPVTYRLVYEDASTVAG
jgi:hypothetical protein